MPRIIVQTDAASEHDPAVTYTERVVADHLRSEHHSAQLVERLVWAIADAEQAERETPTPPRGARPAGVPAQQH